MNALTTFSYAGSKITFANESGVRVNATQMAKPFKKTPKDWLRLQSTQEFIATLSAVRQICLTGLVITKQGGNGEQGTWMHEDVALEFARWLSPKFAIWCNDRIKELLATPPQPTDAPQLSPPIGNQQVTHSLVEVVDGKPVTTSRKLAQLLGREHSNILDTIKRNMHLRDFKYGNFTTRPYSSGTSHGYEYLITRRGLKVLAMKMRYGAKDIIAEAYAGAWGLKSKALPLAEAVPAVEDVKALPATEPEPVAEPEPRAVEPVNDSENGDIMHELVSWVLELKKELKDARNTMKRYAELYEKEKAQGKRRNAVSGYWFDLYDDLRCRLLNPEIPIKEVIEAHNAFRERLTDKEGFRPVLPN